VVTVASPGAAMGATSIPVTSFNANANYTTGAGVTTTPAATDGALFNETCRIAATPGVAGAQPGETLTSAYFDSSTPSAIYVEVGYFGGSTATSALGTGTLLARDVEFWSHTAGTDSAAPQLDTKLSLT
jgi:hypothetical protein